MKQVVFRTIGLGVLNAVGLWAATVLFGFQAYLATAFVIAVTLIADYIYISKRTLAARYLLPGVFFLILFQVYPVVYTAYTAFTNYSTGHSVSRAEAIDGVISGYVQPVEDGGTYSMVVIHRGSELALLLTNDATKKVYLGDSYSLKEVTNATLDAEGKAVSLAGWESYGARQLLQPEIQKRLIDLEVPVGESGYIKAISTEIAQESLSTVRYDEKSDQLIDTATGYVFPERNGSFIAEDGTAIEPGWTIPVGFKNFASIVTDSRISGPFFRVFVWTFVWAFLSVLGTFAIGLALALTLNRKMRGQRLYRSLLVIPYAIPSFLSILIWGGLLNDDFGLINRLFGTDIPWLFDGVWAKVAVLLVNFWLGFPYMFLVTTGALQSIPAELSEAASIDGASAFQIFRQIKLPLLFVAVSPLLIASFAFNFNNFGGIYLLTGGGPAMNDSDVAGATDILISYTYKIAFAVGKGQSYGLASAISILIFVIVASISALSFRRTKALENIN